MDEAGLEVEVGGQRRHGGLREVEHARAAVDDDEAEREQGVDRARAEAEDRVLPELRHALVTALCAAVQLLEELLPEAELLHLARRHRPLGHEADVARDLEAGDLPAAELDQLLLVGLAAVRELDERGGDLLQARVGDADDLRDLHRRMRGEVRLDLDRRHVLASDLEHVLEATEERQPPVVVEPAEVAGVEPAAPHRLRNFRLGLVTTLTTLRQFDAARDRIRQVREIAGESLTVWQRVALWAGEASIALEEGDREAALHRLALALAFSRECGEDFSFSNWFRPWMSHLCEEALAAGIELQYVRELIHRYGFSPPTRFSPQWPWPVKIYALGEFQLLLADQAVQFGRKAPRRVLSVLKYILAHGGNGVSLRQVADALWPDVEGDASMRALGVALARLRKLLGGHDVLWVNDERVSLNGKLVWSDSQAFESLVADGDSQNFGLDSAACAQMSAKILSLYRGDFLAADRDEPWALRPRLRLRTRFVRSMASLGTRLEASASWDLAIECYRRGLEVDDLAEEFYQGLMRCYGMLAQPAKAMLVYDRLRQTLSAELGVTPSSASEGLARKLQEECPVASGRISPSQSVENP